MFHASEQLTTMASIEPAALVLLPRDTPSSPAPVPRENRFNCECLIIANVIFFSLLQMQSVLLLYKRMCKHYTNAIKRNARKSCHFATQLNWSYCISIMCTYCKPYSARMSPKNTHKLMGFYMEVLILGVIL